MGVGIGSSPATLIAVSRRDGDGNDDDEKDDDNGDDREAGVGRLSQVVAANSSDHERKRSDRPGGSSGEGAAGDHPELGSVDPFPGRGVGEPGLAGGPDVERRLLAKEGAVALLGPLIPVDKLVILRQPALGGSVVEGAGKNLAAKARPIGLGVDHMEVPRLVHLVGWGAFVARCHAEEDELAIFVDYALGVSNRPAVFAGKSFGEG